MTPVIVESPYAGEVMLNEDYARSAILDCLTKGEAPFASHLLYTQVLDEKIPSHRDFGISANIAMQKVIKKMVVYTDRGISGGMTQAISFAKENGVEVEYRSLFK